MGQTWFDAKELLGQALERPSHEREAFVRQHAGDPKVIGEVLSLLAASSSSDGSTWPPAPPGLPDDADPEFPPGTQIGSYTIIDTIATGGMGRVYLARDPTLHRRVAIKCVRRADPHSADARAVVRREASSAAQITNPHVATIHGLFEEGGRSYIVMEYVDGETLSHLLARGRLPVERALAIAIQLATGLSAAHAKGVVHRDLKPGNVQLTADGTAKILDFGIASVKTAFTTTAATGGRPGPTVVHGGTPGYMPPEQWQRQVVDERSDVFGLGVVLFEMVTGRRACSSDAPLDQQSAPVPRADSVDRSVPRPLADLISRAVAMNPADRFGTVLELRESLERVRHDVITPWWRRVAGHGTPAIVRLVIGALGVAALAVALGYINTTTYNAALQRQDYMNETVGSWLKWGLKSLVVFALVGLGIAALVGIGLVARNALLPMSAPLRAWDDALRSRLRSPLVSSWVVLGLGALLAFMWWSYAPYFGALFTTISASGLNPAQAAIMGPTGEAYRNIGEVGFTLLTIAAVATAVWIGRTAGPAASPATRALIGVTWAIALLALVSFQLPYRFFRPSSVVEKADWNGQPCYILATREPDRLLYCPALTPPVQSRPVNDLAVVPNGKFGNAYDR